MSGVRTKLEVKGRGRLATDASLKRYGKSTKLQAVVSQIPETLQVFGEWAINNFELLIVEAHKGKHWDVPRAPS